MAGRLIATLLAFTIGASSSRTLADAVEPLVWQVRDDARQGAPPLRSQAVAAYDIARARLVVFGGITPVGSVNDTWEWTGTSWLERQPAHAPAIQSQVRALVYDEARSRVVLFTSGDVIWEWDGNDWTSIHANISIVGAPGNGGLGATYDPDRQVAVVLGTATYEWNGVSVQSFPSSHYEGQSNQIWDAPNPSAKKVTLAYDRKRDRTIFVGSAQAVNTTSSQIWERAGTTWSKVITTPPPPQRVDHALFYDEQREVTVLVGGRQELGSNRVLLSDAWTWDGTAWTKIADTTPLGARTDLAASYDRVAQRAYFFGGARPGVRNDLWSWSANSWHLESRSTLPPFSVYASMAYDRARRVSVLFGGLIAGLNVGNETWEWDGSSWNEKETVIAPPARHGHTMTYDVDRQRVVLFGGALDANTNQLTNDTWEWDGVSWVERHPTHTPLPCLGPAADYDPVRQRVVMFGGSLQGGSSNATWLWNGTDWSTSTPLVVPSARAQTTLAYDGTRQKIVLYGGDGELRDLWTWDGTWTEISPSTALPSSRAQAVYHDVRRRLLFFLSTNVLSQPTEIWELSENEWISHAITPSPGPPSSLTFVYDAARVRMVLQSTADSVTWELRAAGGSCTSNAQCDEGTCASGRCVSAGDPPPIPADAGSPDASTDAGTWGPGDAGTSAPDDTGTVPLAMDAAATGNPSEGGGASDDASSPSELEPEDLEADAGGTGPREDEDNEDLPHAGTAEDGSAGDDAAAGAPAHSDGDCGVAPGSRRRPASALFTFASLVAALATRRRRGRRV